MNFKFQISDFKYQISNLRRRRGAATLDYVLLMGVILPLATFVLWMAPRMMQRVYEVLCIFVGLPWM